MRLIMKILNVLCRFCHFPTCGIWYERVEYVRKQFVRVRCIDWDIFVSLEISMTHPCLKKDLLLLANGLGIRLELRTPKRHSATLAVQFGAEALELELPSGEWMLLVLDLLPGTGNASGGVLRARTALSPSHKPRPGPPWINTRRARS